MSQRNRLTPRIPILIALALLPLIGCSPSASPSARSAKPTPDAARAPSENPDAARGADPTAAPPRAVEPMQALDAWTAAAAMTPGINIGNTLENTTEWETGWGNPTITREFVERLASLGFKSVRLPVAWDTYAVDGKIQPDKLGRVAEVADWIIDAGMFAVVNIHWDGGWIDSSNKEKFADTYATFSADAERKFRAYWAQIAAHFADRGEKLLFEALNEETEFSGEGSEQQAYATLARVGQLFIDTVRASGGNNARRLLIVAGYHTDFAKTCGELYELPKDTVANKLFISVHYYTPWTFCGLAEDADWGRVKPSWGSEADVTELQRLFDQMERFSKRHDIPVYLGEYNVTEHREAASRLRWLTAVTQAAVSRKMVPVLWDTGGEVSRTAPHTPSPVLQSILEKFQSAAL